MTAIGDFLPDAPYDSLSRNRFKTDVDQLR